MLRVKFEGSCVTPVDTLREQARQAMHLPRVQFHSRSGRLAVVGGGPSVAEHLDELRGFTDIWAINHTCEWLAGHGIESTFYTVDGDPVGAMEPKCKKALVSSWCAPATFAALSNADVQVVDLQPVFERGLPCGSSSASTAPLLALMMGYRDVSFFGCEGSYVGNDHVDRHENSSAQLVVRAGGIDYITRPPLYVQCSELAVLCGGISHIYHNRSGGLLQAMIDNPDSWEVVAYTADLRDQFNPQDTTPYLPRVA